MKKFILFTILFFTLTFNVKALEYKDVTAPIVGHNPEEVVTIYLFHGFSCPHCINEIEYLNELKEEYGNKIDIQLYETYKSPYNSTLMSKVKEHFNIDSLSVPFTVIGENFMLGFSTTTKAEIKTTIDRYLDLDDSTEDEKTLPILGKIQIKEVSLPLVAIVLGFIDGFNPCAMWILLFLINMLFNMKDRKKMWILGITFLFTSAFVYFLAMLGINFVLSFTAVTWIKILIGLIAIIGGFVNLRSYVKTKDNGCNVVDEKKRKKYFTRIKNIITENNFFLAILGIIVLAASVNIVELACSAGFPATFVEILNINNLSLIKEIGYILLYVLFFLLDDLIIFFVAMKTLNLTGISTKYNRLSHLIGGILMVIMGLMLIFKPEWLMFNF